MGMDYRFVGSASYPRFNKEITAIAELFGGTLKEDIQEDTTEIFIFKDNISKAFQKWVNTPYEMLNYQETEEVYNILQTKREQIIEISPQIVKEFDIIMECGTVWDIC